MIRISHHRIKCIGCNYCVEAAPNTWKMEEADGKAILQNATNKKGFYIVVTGDDEYQANKEAADICPVKIIRVEKTK